MFSGFESDLQCGFMFCEDPQMPMAVIVFLGICTASYLSSSYLSSSYLSSSYL